MSKVVVFISMSLDGFIAGPNPSPQNPLGDNGLILHDWFFKSHHKDSPFRNAIEDNGAVIMGRVMYEESLPYWHGSGPLGKTPCFVLTEKGTEPKNAAPMFTFVSEGIESALAQAKEAANDKNVFINGGAHTIQQFVKAKLIDELTIHVVPILLGGGTSLFGSLGEYIELEKQAAKDEKDVTHLRYSLPKM